MNNYNPITDIRAGIVQQAEERARKLAEAKADAQNQAEKEARESEEAGAGKPEAITPEQQIELLTKAVAELTIKLDGMGK